MALWDRIHSRGEVEDRRSMAPIALGGISVTGLAIFFILNVLSGGDLSDTMNVLNTISVPHQTIDTSVFEGKDSYETFVSTVLGSTNDMWTDIFKKLGKQYFPPKFVLFRTATESGCGGASSDVGPHYCPLDKTIYLDETFFEELTNRFHARGGDVAEAYVIAHEVGHHAQNELLIMDQVEQKMEEDTLLSNDLSITLELQADCFAGLWANSIKHLGVFLPDEINEALDAASAVGDDRIQKAINGRINPESWTHGSSTQRVDWFTKGYDSGSLESCNTFVN